MVNGGGRVGGGAGKRLGTRPRLDLDCEVQRELRKEQGARSKARSSLQPSTLIKAAHPQVDDLYSLCQVLSR